MHALVEVLQPQQAERTDEREQRARQHEHRDQDRRPRRQGIEMAHSITSPRIRNLDRATVLAKPSSAMISPRSEEHTSELQSLMRISYAVFFLQKNKKQINTKE